jgi:hypothetical protein
MTLPPLRTETPTQFDLARWLFERIEAIEGPCKGRMAVLSLMYECMGAVRPPEKPRSNKTE